MAMSMVCSLPQALNAEAIISSSVKVSTGIRKVVMPATKKTQVSSGETNSITDPKAPAKLNIEISTAIALGGDVEFTATLSKEGKGEIVEKVKLDANNSVNTLTFNDIVSDTYQLKIEAPGFTQYINNEVVIDNKIYTLKVTAGLGGYKHNDEEKSHPGLLKVGDVNGDNEIGEEDEKILLDIIDGTSNKDEYPAADLNRDGEVNLQDFIIFSESFGEEFDINATTIESAISPETVEASVPEETAMKGSLADLMKASAGVASDSDDQPAPVSLSPSDGGKISADTPVEIGFDLTGEDKAGVAEIDGISIASGKENPVEEAEFTIIVVENGVEREITVPVVADIDFLLEESNVTADIDANGNINLHLGGQIAVKKVSLKIMAMQKNSNLAEISKVEFVNGMEDRIPEPELDRPMNLKAKAGSKQFSITWDPCLNVKGYQVKISKGGQEEIINTNGTSMTISTFNKKEVENYVTYKVSVQSVNGSWSSGYCDEIVVTPQSTKRPDKPDMVKAKGGEGKIVVSWNKMPDTLSYTVFYREQNETTFTSKTTYSNSYNIEGLSAGTEYEIYVVGHNDLGSSPESTHVLAEPVSLNLADMPKYKLINRDSKGRPGKTHITNVERYGGTLVDSVVDNEDTDNATGNSRTKSAWATVDGVKSSYYLVESANDGGWNSVGVGNGLTYTFDKAYKFDTIGILTTTGIDFTHCLWWDEEGKQHNEFNGAWDYRNYTSRKVDAQGRPYYMLRLPYPVTATKFQIGISRYGAPISVAETYFYEYDSLIDEVFDLYVDDLHTVLRDDVTQETIDELREKINLPDEFGEENFNKQEVLNELKTAEDILNSKALTPSVPIYNTITTNDTGRGFSGLNAWQPLGATIGTGQSATVYVGCNNKKTGANTNVKLVVVQYHAEYGNVILQTYNLKVGANNITLTNGSLASQENGGAMYIQYEGDANSGDKYSVRVNGATQVPKLDLYKVTDREERMARAIDYVTKLDTYVAGMEELHNEVHGNAKNNKLKKAYDEQNCILGASDIMLDTMMISLPAKQMLAGTGTGSVEERAEKLVNSMDAMEEMMYLFYQHKGLNASASNQIDQIPKGHLNIRYQQMFTGAFMYASGNHIGIEWGSASGLMQGVPIKSTEEGKYISGGYFGWGIAHEIGHNINQGAYTVAEITNNYFAQLAQAKDTNEGMRFQYENIYNKVTSGAKGDCSNIATQLGMYWQLHLAYDKGLNYKTYSDYNEQLKNLFYARVDTYARNTSKAPRSADKEKAMALSVNGDTDQNLMRLACAAAEKNVLEFFERWGKVPNAETKKYAEQFPKETRAIQYANDDSRIYALNGDGGVLGTESSVEAIKDVSVKIGADANKVDLKFTTEGVPEADILGYEVIRCTIEGGEVEETPVGFAQSNSFTDTVATMNNRAVYYKVTLIDQYLNRSAVYTTDMIKIEHDGSMDKTNWTVSVSGLEATKEVHEATEEMPCDKTESKPEEQAIDTNLNTIYNPTVKSNNAEIVIDFHQTLTATGLKYTAGEGNSAGQYEVYVLVDGTWKLTAEGTFNGSETVYFANDDNEYISTYATTSVKLVLLNQQNQNISIAELDVLSPTGDNVDFRRTEGEKVTVIGKLDADYKYGTKDTDVIPGGSVIFTGSYKGNPAYNVVILYDKDGNIVGGKDAENNTVADQIILADVPEKGNIANVSNGTWIYWIEPEYLSDLPDKVRVELYRVNKAETNEGQRLVSDSLFEDVPATLPTITLGK